MAAWDATPATTTDVAQAFTPATNVAAALKGCATITRHEMRIHAAILWEQGKPLSVEPIQIGSPGPSEVLVEMRAAGVCHSDLHPARGDWPMKVPVVLGHEGAGVVREVGSNVTRVRKDDHVCLLYTSPSPRDGLLSRMPSSA